LVQCLSGVLQQTLLEAHQGHAEFRGHGDAALLACVKQILARNLVDGDRQLKRGRRD
jgi:hypothetical protein